MTQRKLNKYNRPKVVKELREQFASKDPDNKDQKNANMMVHHSRITIDKHWEETMIHIIRALTIISRKYLEINFNIEADPIATKIFESY